MKPSRSRFSFSRSQGRSTFQFITRDNPRPVLLLSNDRPMRYTIALTIVTFVVCIAIQHLFKN